MSRRKKSPFHKSCLMKSRNSEEEYHPSIISSPSFTKPTKEEREQCYRAMMEAIDNFEREGLKLPNWDEYRRRQELALRVMRGE